MHGYQWLVQEVKADDLPYTTLGYANGPGFHFLPEANTADAITREEINFSRRADLSDIDTTHPGFHSEVTVPMGHRCLH